MDVPVAVTIGQPAGKYRRGPHFRVPPSQGRPKKVFTQCHGCGYDPAGAIPPTGRCPKCGGSSRDRFALAAAALGAEAG